MSEKISPHMSNIGIFGSAGFARETADIAFAMGLQPIFIAHNEDEKHKLSSDFECILESELDHFPSYPLAIGIDDTQTRQAIAERFQQRHFLNLIHPNASFGYRQKETLVASKGIIICAGVRFSNSINIGDFCVLHLNATVAHDCDIDDFVTIAPGANISGNVKIESGCWIGANATINQGTEKQKLIIGARTTIGSGAVVVKHCDPDSTYIGIPAAKAI